MRGRVGREAGAIATTFSHEGGPPKFCLGGGFLLAGARAPWERFRIGGWPGLSPYLTPRECPALVSPDFGETGRGCSSRRVTCTVTPTTLCFSHRPGENPRAGVPAPHTGIRLRAAAGVRALPK